ncbi:MAG: hypothetical protein QOF48_3489, partial [Verrucomicrobiota bacterium]
MSRKDQCFQARCIRLTFAILTFATAGVHSATGAGVTVITHGFELLPGLPAWMTNMATTIMGAAEAKGLTTSWYHIQITDAGFGSVNGDIQKVSTREAMASEEVVMTVDWSAVANHLNSSFPFLI